MPTDDGHAGTPDEATSFELALLLIGAGAILLLVSLFLTWYEPGIDAWEIFEVWDLVLALLAIVALTAIAGRLGFGSPRPASWIVAPALAALVIVLFSIINPPPLSGSVDGTPATGLWLALTASVLMAAGALMSVARISIAISTTPHDGPAASSTPEPADSGRAPGTDPAKPSTPQAADDPPSEDPTRRL